MAILHITEYSHVLDDANGNIVQAGREPATARQTLTHSTTAQSSTFHNNTTFVRLVSDTDCYLNFGKGTVVATTGTGTLLKANTVEFFGVKQNLDYRVAAVS